MAEDVELFAKFPLISCEDSGKSRKYTGKVFCANKDVDLCVIEENGAFRLLSNEISPINALNISDFLTQVIDVLSKQAKTSRNLTNLYRKVLYEYSEFTRFHFNLNKCQLLPDFSQINVSTIDGGGREHNLKICIDFNKSKDIFAPAHLDLPEKATEFAESYSNLTDLYGKFVAVLENLQDFFDVMDLIDLKCSILDPERPTRRDCHRRIWLDHNLSLLVTVDPLNARARPDVTFLGPERLISKNIEQMSEKLDQWDANDVIGSLLHVVNLEQFPRKPNLDPLTEAGECSICFSRRLDDKLPDVVCDNKCCGTFYHSACLSEWLLSMNSKRTFNQLMGNCPNCEKVLKQVYNIHQQYF